MIEEYGIFPLQLGELTRVCLQHAHRMAELRPEIRGHTPLAVRDVVEHLVTRPGAVQSHGNLARVPLSPQRHP